MSGYEENPFADPFAEPSIQQVVNPPATSTVSGLEDYDPFSPNTNLTQSVNSQPATLPPSTQGLPAPAAVPAPPTYTPTAQQATAAEFQELKRRQEELEAKARELARREEQLKQASGGPGRVENNWPPLPSQFPVGPCFYQDINVEIPLEFQRIVRLTYHLWLFHALMLIMNMLGGLAILLTNGTFNTFGLSLFYLILFTPVSYLCWFRSLYKAFRNDSSFNFMVFFFIFFFQTTVATLSAIGVPSMGSCGWLAVGSAFSSGSVGLGVFLVFVALGSTADAVAMGAILMWVHRIYRSTGASFAKAQAEFTHGVMTNEHMQNATAAAASNLVRNQFSGSTAASMSTTPTSSDPRF